MKSRYQPVNFQYLFKTYDFSGGGDKTNYVFDINQLKNFITATKNKFLRKLQCTAQKLDTSTAETTFLSTMRCRIFPTDANKEVDHNETRKKTNHQPQ